MLHDCKRKVCKVLRAICYFHCKENKLHLLVIHFAKVTELFFSALKMTLSVAKNLPPNTKKKTFITKELL